tara:strand:+ start:75 stop:194 length:120 start_codon:yes stop_codon:yes gene_type:complete
LVYNCDKCREEGRRGISSIETGKRRDEMCGMRVGEEEKE